MKTTFLCVYNNEEILNKSLLPSIMGAFPDTKFLNGDPVDAVHTALLIKNSDKRYKSAAEAYNTTIKENMDILGDILVFLHQDIAFDDSSFLLRIKKELESNPNRILGPAGMCNDGILYSNLKHRKDGNFVVNNNIKSVKYKGIESLDECFFSLKKDLFLKLWFDTETCFHWHLYCSELCYHAKIKYGTEIGVIPDQIYHKDDNKGGVLTTNTPYLKTLWRMAKKYRNDVDFLYTSCCSTKTSYLGVIFTILKYRIAQIIK